MSYSFSSGYIIMCEDVIFLTHFLKKIGSTNMCTHKNIFSHIVIISSVPTIAVKKVKLNPFVN